MLNDRRFAAHARKLFPGVELPYYVTGTYHGSIIYAHSEGEARRIFHKAYGGESIRSVFIAGRFRPVWL